MTVPSVVAVVGGGRMGAGIAHAFLVAGAAVLLREPDADATARAVASIQRDLDRSVARGMLADAATARSRLRIADDISDLAAAGLAIEAVPEDAGLKTRVLGDVERHLDDDAWLCTNTSSLSIDELAASLARPERFCGLHFFNPVPAGALVEIVRGTATTAELVDSARAWVDALGKTPIVVRDSPGFASSRLGIALGLEAIRMLEESVASAADIDAAMVLGYRHPVGPLRLTDLVGLDVRLDIAQHLERELGERFTPPALLRRLVAEGRLGRKSGAGFYEWPEEVSS